MVVGWDIGGVNTKVALVSGGRVTAVLGRPYELQREPAALVQVLRDLAAAVGAPADAAHAVTMTAELSQMFRTKREGVAFVIDAVEQAFPGARLLVYGVDGRFSDPAAARRDPLRVAAANWAATAIVVAAVHPDALLIDIGTTTTDIIPIAGGVVAATGRTDPERLLSGELVYTGAVRTPAEAMASHVSLGSRPAGVSAESFALSGDVHVWRGDLAVEDYTAPTPDGRPVTREFAGERLARVVCADREMLDDAAISRIAEALANAQIARIADAIVNLLAHHPTLRLAIVAGVGAFIAERAARLARLDVVRLASELGNASARCAPAAAVALMLDAKIHDGGNRALSVIEQPLRRATPSSGIEVVVKLGGGVLAHASHFESALIAIADAARDRALVVIPGGGPFADAVRDVDRQMGLGDDAAHWMAILGMDQYACLVAARLPGAVVVDDEAGVRDAVARGRVPVLAPSRWLRAADPLPHSWDVTSDSISAWLAGRIGAPYLVLVKPPGVDASSAVDPYFDRALPPHVEALIVNQGDPEALQRSLRDPSSADSMRFRATVR